jgi:hypothetical protein
VEIEICIGRWEKPETDDFYRARVIIYMTDKNHLFSCDINGNRSLMRKKLSVYFD